MKNKREKFDKYDQYKQVLGKYTRVLESQKSTDEYLKHKMGLVKMWKDVRGVVLAVLQYIGGIVCILAMTFLLIGIIDWSARQIDRLKKVDALENKVSGLDGEWQAFQMVQNAHDDFNRQRFENALAEKAEVEADLIARVARLEHPKAQQPERHEWFFKDATPLIITNAPALTNFFWSTNMVVTNDVYGIWMTNGVQHWR